jgi:hypothetical protein
LGKKAYGNITDNKCSKTVEAYIKSKKWTFALSLPTTTMSMLPNAPLPHSRNTSLWGWPQLTGELNFLHYSNSKRFYSEPDVVKYGKTLIAEVLFRT